MNYVLAERRQFAVCAYDITRFGAVTMMDVLRTHPMVEIGDALYQNPFFVSPDEFLKDLEAQARDESSRHAA